MTAFLLGFVALVVGMIGSWDDRDHRDDREQPGETREGIGFHSNDARQREPQNRRESDRYHDCVIDAAS